LKQSPIFSKTYDFVAWIIPLTVKFPRQQRFVMAAALQREALCFQERLIEAAHQRQPGEMLITADAELDKLRTHLRLCRDLGLVSPGQYEHAAGMLVEMGRLLGGWQKKALGSGA
jgi:four helix bundle protein